MENNYVNNQLNNILNDNDEELVFYNNNIKHQFLNFCITTNVSKITLNLFKKFFTQTFVIEKILNKDIVDMNFEEIYLLLCYLKVNKSSFHSYEIIFRLYFDWCLKNNYTNNRTNFLDFVDSSKIILKIEQGQNEENKYFNNKYFKDGSSLLSFLNKVCAPIEDDTIDNYIRAVVFFIYLGVEVNDIFSFLKKDVDLKLGIIKYNNKIIKIPDAFLKEIIYYNDMIAYRQASKGNAFVYRYKQDSFWEYFFNNGTSTCTLRDENWQNIVKGQTWCSFTKLKTRFKEKYKKKIDCSFLSIWHSGIFNRVYQKENLLNTQFTDKEILEAFIKEMSPATDISTKQLTKIKAKAKSIQNIYKEWKNFYNF